MTLNFSYIGIWILRLVAAVIMLQTLYFKFSGATESIYIFSAIGMEPWGRIGTGIVELVASVLILFPRTTHLGAVLAMGLMAGAVWFHITKLGIEVMGDGGQLFVYALLVLLASSVLLIIYRDKLLLLFR
jgi:uncharacterized membrane protein YphA (DoxX/SURF4 family)